MKWLRNLFIPSHVWVVRFHQTGQDIVSRVFIDEDTKNRYVELMVKWGYNVIIDEETQVLFNNNGD